MKAPDDLTRVRHMLDGVNKVIKFSDSHKSLFN